MFYFSGFTPETLAGRVNAVYALGFPHSDIAGSKVARHLPDAYRRHATSFIASQNQGIHHTPLCSSTQTETHFRSRQSTNIFLFADQVVKMQSVYPHTYFSRNSRERITEEISEK